MVERMIQGEENRGLNDDAEVLRLHELMLRRTDSQPDMWKFVNASDDRAIMEINKDRALHAWDYDENE